MFGRRPKVFSIVALAAGAGLIAIAACVGPADDPVPSDMAVCVSPMAMPTGFGYPESAATIAEWVAGRDEASIRRHGWQIFAALNTAPDAAGEPVWRSWCTSTQAFASVAPTPSPMPTPTGAAPVGGSATMTSDGRMRSLNAIKAAHGEPINFATTPQYTLPEFVLNEPKYSRCVIPGSDGQPASLTDGSVFQSNGDIMIAGVVYNGAAYDWIRSKQLYEAATLNALQPARASGQAEIPEMPSGAIVLKPMLWPVPNEGYSALPIWDGEQSDGGKYAGYEIQTMWPRAVAVTTRPDRGADTQQVSFLHGVTMNDATLGPNRYDGAPVVGVDRFYNFTPDLAALGDCDRALLDASAYWAYGKRFAQGDRLVLVAMHIMTKEQPAWTFQSLWWHDHPNRGPYAANRPQIPGATGPWNHYLMTTTYGVTAQPNGSTWPIAYNPYIELAAAHPIATNCMNCHHRAAWSSTNPENVSYLLGGGPGALQVFAQDNAIFNGLVKTDSMWAISSRAITPTPTPSPSPTRVGN